MNAPSPNSATSLDQRIVLAAWMIGIALTGFFSLAIVTLPLRRNALDAAKVRK